MAPEQHGAPGTGRRGRTRIRATTDIPGWTTYSKGCWFGVPAR
jgi:hypothetical protein